MIRRLPLLLLFVLLGPQVTLAQEATQVLPASLGTTYEATVDLALTHGYLRYDPAVISQAVPTSLISSDLILHVKGERVLLRFDEEAKETSVVAEFAHEKSQVRRQVEEFFRDLEARLSVAGEKS